MNLSYSAFSFTVLAALTTGVDASYDDRQCGTASDLQRDYRGIISTTANGRTCQNWTHQSPHSHSNTPANRAGKGLGDHNYCRNPDNEPKAWCYTTDPAKRWEFCEVPDCATATYPTLAAPTEVFDPASVTAEMIAEVYEAPTTGYCVNAANGDLVDKVQIDGTYTSDAEGPAICYNFCDSWAVDAPGFVAMQWRKVSKGARCICYFDDGTVPEVLPGGVDTMTGNPSVGPVVGSGSADHYCYQYKGYMDANRRSIYGGSEALTDYLNFEVYGTQLQIANQEKEYDQNQNPNFEGKVSPTFDNTTHTTLSASGNTWSAYLLPQAIDIRKDTVLQFDFTLTEETMDGFQAICLDNDTEETGSNGKCFVLRSSQGWVSHMINVPTQTTVGSTTSHSIPVGDFFEGTVNYIAYLQDSDGQDRTMGASSISNLKLVELTDEKLEIEIDGQVEYLVNDQVSFKLNNGNQDTSEYWMHISEDHTAVQINGNQWKGLPLNTPYDVTANTILEFDMVIDQSVDYHAICLDTDTNLMEVNGKFEHCVVIQNPLDTSIKTMHHITTKLQTGVPKRVVIPFGSYMNLKADEVESVSYIAFIQDNDKAAISNGRSTWSNFRLYQDPTRFDVSLTLFNETVSVANIQEPLQNDAGDLQDSRDHIMSVSADGTILTAMGNSWKMLKLPSTIMVSPPTMLKFEFSLTQESEIHAICLLDEIRVKDGRNDCFMTAGTQNHDSRQGIKLTPSTQVGETRTYEINIGSYFTGEVKYLGIVLDNDNAADRTVGQSSWSNIELYNLPSLDITVDGSIISIENHQLQYDSNQDSGPIRDNMATIDGPSINFSGNMWRAIQLPTPLAPADLGDFVVSFDYTITEAGEIHAICFDENREYGNQADPKNRDARRCIATSYFQQRQDPAHVLFSDFQARVGESHRYVLNLSKMFDRMYNPINYIAFVHDNDLGDKSAGDSTYSNIAITTSLSSCLDDADFSFNLTDCTTGNFLDSVKQAMINKGEACGADPDPLMELFKIFDATQETDVYKQIEKICTSSYKLDQYDFADSSLGIDEATERQLVKEYIDGGTVLNYEAGSDNAVNVGYVNTEYASSRLLDMPKHHALDNCHVGAAMCCFVASKTDPAPAEDKNSDVCLVNMKASRRTARVADGYSIYQDNEPVYCEGFAWDADGGSISSALKGNALFHVSLNKMYTSDKVEQVPGAPLCGCLDRMPVVTHAACTSVESSDSVVSVTYDSAAGLFRSTFNLGTVDYGNCGGNNLVEHYELLATEGKVSSVDAAYVNERIVGHGNCPAAISSFLAGKGLQTA